MVCITYFRNVEFNYKQSKVLLLSPNQWNLETMVVGNYDASLEYILCDAVYFALEESAAV